MARAQQVFGDVVIAGQLRVTKALVAEGGGLTDASLSPTADVSRAKLAQNPDTPFPLDLSGLRVHDDLRAVLPGTAAGDDLALVQGTFGTDAPMLQSADQASNGTPTVAYARALVRIPESFDTAQSLAIRLSGRMQTVADTTATVDVEAYLSDRNGSVGSDLVSEAAESINSANWADRTFAVTSASITPGDVLDVRIAVTIEDGATASGVIAEIGAIELLADIRG